MSQTPSPESLNALRAVRDVDATIPSPPPVPSRRTIMQHPATKIGGALGAIATVLVMLVPVWQTWLDQGHKMAVLDVKLESLTKANRLLTREVRQLKSENAALRKQLKR